MPLPQTIDCPKHPGTRSWLKTSQYGEYYSHKDDSAPKGYCNTKTEDVTLPNDNDRFQPETPHNAPAPVQSPAVRRASEPDPDAKGKVRHGVFVAVVERDGLDAALKQWNQIVRATEAVMTGVLPGSAASSADEANEEINPDDLPI